MMNIQSYSTHSSTYYIAAPSCAFLITQDIHANGRIATPVGVVDQSVEALIEPLTKYHCSEESKQFHSKSESRVYVKENFYLGINKQVVVYIREKCACCLLGARVLIIDVGPCGVVL